MGDAASNIGRAGHNQRHQTLLRQVVLIMQGVWGTLVEMEPQDHLGYSNDYRPDVTGRGLGKARTRLIGDVGRGGGCHSHAVARARVVARPHRSKPT